MNKNFIILFAGFLVIALAAHQLPAQNQSVELKDFDKDTGQINLAGFTLNSARTVKIHAIGAGADKTIKRIHSFQEDKFNLFAYAWIIDAKSRKLVWRMTQDNSKTDWWDKWNREFMGEVKLPAGEYELYFAAVEPTYFSLGDGFLSFGRLMDKIFGSDTWWEDHSNKWLIQVSGADAVLNEQAVRKYQKALKETAIISLTDIGDRAYESRGFTLTKQLNVVVYAIGEGFKGEMYDSGWIVDAKTREKIWEMREQDSEYAGGAVKNRVFEKKLVLAPGNYIVYYKSDDNHSDARWNANPPYDPFFWGISIQPDNPDFDRAVVKKFEDSEKNSVVKISRVRDNDYREEGFRVNRKSNFRIYALGEGRDGEMFDYGWITDVKTGQIIWKMRFKDTIAAGGASKNRMLDQVVELSPGEYMLHYQSDDSHSYEDWNTSPPIDAESWGVAIYPVNDNKAAERIDSFTTKNENILAELTRIGDDEHVKKQFTLKKKTRVRIYAIGEGDWDEMYDYGWIEDVNTGNTVWKMRYRDTENAGGAKKNRKIDTVINLDSGTYRVHFSSDDSHSYYNWNATQPHDPTNWGITVFRLDK
ncbi:MAG: hypothetical protein AB7T22_01450 [Calditrichaceae bacterium]